MANVSPHFHPVLEDGSPLAIKASFVTHDALRWSSTKSLGPWNSCVIIPDAERAEGANILRCALEITLTASVVNLGLFVLGCPARRWYFSCLLDNACFFFLGRTPLIA